jgi:hypothetical protein
LGRDFRKKNATALLLVVVDIYSIIDSVWFLLNFFILSINKKYFLQIVYFYNKITFIIYGDTNYFFI